MTTRMSLKLITEVKSRQNKELQELEEKSTKERS
jgi:hypothetical protein